ncbi:DUF4349 domain-containing protein [Fuerstiella marisgermanici]|uniref:DUF4349 domain-containing protein n=1 Tax=Fuerstiella marisgermanici TaxID=1891926 RepID=A0A1P8WL58_9PLAN|nr:DUF4349 domain-containing protein [Fuerstiella marisgermanici]APZ94785.1 hypothetical protein Fuma_04424 [Fuerstiella marisgermanici]
MTSNRSILLGTFLFSVLIGCSQNGSVPQAMSGSGSSEMFALADESQREAPQAEEKAAVSDPVARMIIRNGELAWKTADRTATGTRIRAAAQRSGGYLSGEHETRSEHRIDNYLTVRVPADRFEPLLADVSDGVDHFDTRQISATDVTDQFVDLDARLRVKKDTETRYRELLSEARNVDEVLKVERELSKLRGDIEAMEGKWNLLKNQAAMSTLTIRYYEITSVSNHFTDRFADSLRLGWLGIVEFVIAIAVMWPMLVIGLCVALVVRRIISASTARSAVQTESGVA